MSAVDEVGLLRLAAQRIAGPGLSTPGDAVRWLMAAQAQDHTGAIVSVALRTAERRRADVEAALTAGEIVKSWPMRGTLHLVAAQDLQWMLELLGPRVEAGAAGRRAQLGLDEATLDRAGQVALAALAGGRHLRRAELYAAWDGNGLPTAAGRGYHMLFHLGLTGAACFGPVDDGEHLIVGVAEWIPAPRRLARDEALGELAGRYFAGHGPATLKDLMRWAHLVAADARAGLAVARGGLEAMDVDGVEHYMGPATPARLDGCRAAARGVFLLPGFDELILGYQDRTAVLAAEFADRIVPGGNGVFRPTVVSDGRVVGTWKEVGRGARRTLVATPFGSFTDDVGEAITRAYAGLPSATASTRR